MHRTVPQAQTPGASRSVTVPRNCRRPGNGMVPIKVLLRLANFLCGHECPCENWSATPGCGALLLLRASPHSRKRQTTAPTPARLFLPRAAPRLRCQRRLPVSSTGCNHYVCIVPCRRHKRRERAGAQRLRGSVGDPETVWYPLKFFAKLFFKKAGKSGCGRRESVVY